MPEKDHYQILIVGGGAAGITVAASLRRRAKKSLEIAIVEPSEFHDYQPAFTLVGAGAYSLSKTRRSEASVIPSGVTWVRDAVAAFRPEENSLELASGATLHYDNLVVCLGLELQWDRVEGLTEALGRRGVCSNYAYDQAEYTWKCIRRLTADSRALFTQPPMPFKCAGAPQKIAYLTADHLRRQGLLQQCELHFLTQAPSIFGVPYFAKRLVGVAARYEIEVHYQHNLTSIDGEARTATFDVVDAEGASQKTTMSFDMIHVTPPQGPSELVRTSDLANAAGWVDVDQNTLQSTKYANVFALGDVCSAPNSKTAAAIRKQAPVVVRNLCQRMEGREPSPDYDGYASCPLVTAYGKVILAEFVYGGKVTPSLPLLDPGKERSIGWFAKKSALPIMYWDYMLKGRELFFAHNKNWQEPSD